MHASNAIGIWHIRGRSASCNSGLAPLDKAAKLIPGIMAAALPLYLAQVAHYRKDSGEHIDDAVRRNRLSAAAVQGLTAAATAMQDLGCSQFAGIIETVAELAAKAAKGNLDIYVTPTTGEHHALGAQEISGQSTGFIGPIGWFARRDSLKTSIVRGIDHHFPSAPKPALVRDLAELVGISMSVEEIANQRISGNESKKGGAGNDSKPQLPDFLSAIKRPVL